MTFDNSLTAVESKSNQIKSNKIFILFKKIQIKKRNELIQCHERGHKGLQRASYMYPKVHIIVKHTAQNTR